jgi:glycosyltransferase involved in cell wall biosynthesis
MSPPFLDRYAGYKERRNHAQPTSSCNAPVVSVVTVTLNAEKTIERTIQSVHEQSLRGIEHVLVDGNSTDRTMDIMRRLARAQDFWIAESDTGISDAFNKGVAMARGRFIKILNADDWLSQDQIEHEVDALSSGGFDFVFGDLIFYEGGQPLFRSVGDANYQRAIRRRMPAIGHPTVLASHTCFERIGLFDQRYHRAMDYDWLLRLHLAGAKGGYDSRIVGHMSHEGVSNREFQETIDEVRRIVVAHGRNPFMAAAEANIRRLKTATSRPIKRHARPLYDLVRALINPSYRPITSGR